MKKLTIKKNKHRLSLFHNFSLPLILNKNKEYVFENYVEFTDSCLYKFDDGYRGVNKLFGFSIGYHHHTSFRFGWRPSIDLKQIEIIGYEYKRKVRQPYVYIAKIEINRICYFKMSYIPEICRIKYFVSYLQPDHILKNYYEESYFDQKSKYRLSYKLGHYFGGIHSAPHDINYFVNE